MSLDNVEDCYAQSVAARRRSPSRSTGVQDDTRFRSKPGPGTLVILIVLMRIENFVVGLLGISNEIES
jgi:hypothetical protein